MYREWSCNRQPDLQRFRAEQGHSGDGEGRGAATRTNRALPGHSRYGRADRLHDRPGHRRGQTGCRRRQRGAHCQARCDITAFQDRRLAAETPDRHGPHIRGQGPGLDPGLARCDVQVHHVGVGGADSERGGAAAFGRGQESAVHHSPQRAHQRPYAMPGRAGCWSSSTSDRMSSGCPCRTTGWGFPTTTRSEATASQTCGPTPCAWADALSSSPRGRTGGRA